MLNLFKYHKQAPRYTSYPTAPQWESLSAIFYQRALEQQNHSPLSLYIHIPFCQSMCLFCGCSVILNRDPKNEETYVDYLCHEMRLVASYLKGKQKVTQLHFGGGTPTKLSIEQLSLIINCLQECFDLLPCEEKAIEIDPRTVFADRGKKLIELKHLGFNRISFGVQDTNLKVQETIKRRQSYEMTKETFFLAKELGFLGINIDLIYGLPYQTLDTFEKTITEILSFLPDRIALFSYAHIPWLKKHQNVLKKEFFPTLEEKFAIYEMARQTLVKAGYISIGMDHFALPHDELAKSYYGKTLQRNFQGYTVKRADSLLGFGVTAIGSFPSLYVQNYKSLKNYYEALDQGILPIEKGKHLSDEDLLRKWVIHTLMCHFELDKSQFSTLFGKDFDIKFAPIQSFLIELEEEGLIQNTFQKLIVTPLGELFIRNIVMHFDAYCNSHSLYSHSI